MSSDRERLEKMARETATARRNLAARVAQAKAAATSKGAQATAAEDRQKTEELYAYCTKELAGFPIQFDVTGGCVNERLTIEKADISGPDIPAGQVQIIFFMGPAVAPDTECGPHVPHVICTVRRHGGAFDVGFDGFIEHFPSFEEVKERLLDIISTVDHRVLVPRGVISYRNNEAL